MGQHAVAFSVERDIKYNEREDMKKSGKSSIILNVLAVLLIGALPDIAGAVTITEFPLPFLFSVPVGITAGPDGNVWFTEQSGNNIGQITPAGVITEFEVPPNPTAFNIPFNVPLGITTGPDGNLWFTESFAASIGQITPAGIVSDVPIFTDSQPFWIASGPDGNLWFTEESFPGDLGLIGQITPAGVVTEFPVPTANSQPLGITTGPDGNLWFTEATGNNIGQITPAGVVTEFPVPTANSQPFGITTGPDGNLWFTEGNGNNIGLAVINNAAIPVPAAQLFFVQSPVVSPVINTAAAQPVVSVSIRPPGTVRASSLASMENSSILAPIGIGPVAAGGSILTIMVGLGKFSDPVDIYFAIKAPAIDPVNIFILTPTGLQKILTPTSLQEIGNVGLVPWLSNTLGNIYVPPIAFLKEFPISRIPPGTYTLYLGVTPTGSTSNFYIWQTSLTL
jgi:hypothetical protein